MASILIMCLVTYRSFNRQHLKPPQLRNDRYLVEIIVVKV